MQTGQPLLLDDELMVPDDELMVPDDELMVPPPDDELLDDELLEADDAALDVLDEAELDVAAELEDPVLDELVVLEGAPPVDELDSPVDEAALDVDPPVDELDALLVAAVALPRAELLPLAAPPLVEPPVSV